MTSQRHKVNDPFDVGGTGRSQHVRLYSRGHLPSRGDPKGRETKARGGMYTNVTFKYPSASLTQQEAMHNFIHDMLHASPAALRIEALWEVRPTHTVFLA